MGSFHDHFLCFRIDLDVQTPGQNVFVKESLVKVRLPENNTVGRKSLWVVLAFFFCTLLFVCYVCMCM